MPKANEEKNVKATAEADVKKETATKTTAKAETAKKTTAAKKTTTKKTTTAAKKTTTTRKKVTEAICVQFAGNEFDITEIVAKAKAAYEGDAKNMKDIKVYVKPEEGMAYYVVNGEETGSVAL